MRFGILGDAKIAREKLVPAMRNAGCEIVHLGRRDQGTSPQHDIWQGVRIGGYEDVLSDPSVEAVYIPLPNHLHVPWAIRALEAGKAVLCEKPLALSLDELDQLERAAAQTGRYIYEAFMVRHHPQWDWLCALDIGERYHLQPSFHTRLSQKAISAISRPGAAGRSGISAVIVFWPASGCSAVRRACSPHQLRQRPIWM